MILTQEQLKKPFIITIFGVTGELSRNKILPTLFSFFKQGLLPEKFYIIGFSRKSWSQQDFSEFVIEILNDAGYEQDASVYGAFLNNCFYIAGLFQEEADFDFLRDTISIQEEVFCEVSQKIYYCAVPPWLYQDIILNMQKNGLNNPSESSSIVLEKPFGTDHRGIEVISQLLAKIFKEEQVYGIDHFLSKNIIGTLFSLRSKNPIFKNNWSSRSVDFIELNYFEKKGADLKIFYDTLGAVGGSGTCLLLNLLSILFADEPNSITMESFHEARLKALKSIRLFSKKTSADFFIRAQYEEYNELEQVMVGSDTETYYHAGFEMLTRRWKGALCFIRCGKAIDRDEFSIKVHFKPSNSLFFPENKKNARSTIMTIDLINGLSIDFTFHSDTESIKIPLCEIKPICDNIFHEVFFDIINKDRFLFNGYKEEAFIVSITLSVLYTLRNTKLKKYKKGEDPSSFIKS